MLLEVGIPKKNGCPGRIFEGSGPNISQTPCSLRSTSEISMMNLYRGRRDDCYPLLQLDKYCSYNVSICHLLKLPLVTTHNVTVYG